MIRPATGGDVAGIRRLMESVPGFWQPAWNDQVVETALRAAGGLAYLWEEEHQVLGFVCAHDVGFRGYLSELVVDPSARRQGIGAALVREVERQLAERGVAVVITDAWRDAEAFYRSLGWSAPDVVLLRRAIR